MRPRVKHRSPQPPRGGADVAADPSPESAEIARDGSGVTPDRGDRSGERDGAHARRLRIFRQDHTTIRQNVRRLGRLEYVLVALIALGCSITIAMAIVNP